MLKLLGVIVLLVLAGFFVLILGAGLLLGKAEMRGRDGYDI